MTWTPLENIDQRGQEYALINKIMNAQKAIVDSEAPNFKGLTAESRNQSQVRLEDVTDK